MQIPNHEYWEKRFEALEAAVHRQGLVTYGDIEKQYLQAMNEIDTVLAAWFQKFMQENNVTFTEAKKMLQGKELAEFRLTIDQYIAKAKEQDLSESWQRKLNNASIRVHVSRLEAILLQLQQHLEVLFNNQLDTLDAVMRSRYTDSYYETAFTIQHGFGIGHSFNQVDTNKLDMLIAKPWAADGKNFSDRVWEHKNKLVAILNQEMTQAVIRGDDYRRAVNNIARRMNVSKGAAGRLVMTESAFFATKAQQDCFKELDVEKYEFIATLDSRTSDICRHMDGKVFKVSDMKPGITAPPLHCHCRSCTAPYFDDAEDAERAARGKDGKTYTVPGDITYKEWEQRFVGDRQKADNDVIINNKENTINVLPNVDKAIIPEAKFTKYALNKEHPKGKDKAIVFESALGFTQNNADELIKIIRKQVPTNEAIKTKSDAYGDRYKVYMDVTGPNGNTTTILTAWLVANGETRLTSAYVKDKPNKAGEHNENK